MRRFTAVWTVAIVWLGGYPLHATAAAADPVVPAAAAEVQPRFQLNELRVLGNSVLSATRISTVLYPFLGPQRSLQDVESARAALEAEYHAAGYGTVFVDIPEQSVEDDGLVRLKVTESRLQRTSLSGTRYFSNRQIRAAIPAASANSVPNLPEIQAQVNAVNAVTADRVVLPVLKAGAAPGTVELNFKVQDTLPLHAVLELNNQYTADTAHLRSSLVASYDNSFGRQDSLVLQLQGAPQETRQVSVFAASYALRLPASGDKLSFSFINSSSEVATLSDITVAGRGRTYGARYTHPVQSDADRQSTASVGLEYRQSAQDVRLSATDSLRTPLNYSSLQLAYSWLLRAGSRNWSWNNSLALGLPALGSSRSEFADKCYGCKPGFLVWRSEAALTQKLPLGLNGVLRLAGQYSVDPLISNEQLLLGGAHSVRGYLEAEEIGDVGARGSLELHLANKLPEKWLLQLEPFAFYDTGVVSFQLPLPGQDRSASLRSTGVGLDWSMRGRLAGTLTLARPLNSGTRTRRGSRRVEFAVRGSW